MQSHGLERLSSRWGGGLVGDIVKMVDGRKGGTGSGFSDPKCRRGIPGQRGGSVNICKPGGLARAAALGVDISDVDINPDDFLKSRSGESKLDGSKVELIKKTVNERIDEPNRVTRRQILHQQLNLPVSSFKMDNQYKSWVSGPRSTPDMWRGAAYLEGLNDTDIQELSGRAPLNLGKGDISGFAESLAADRELSRATYPKGDSLFRGLKVRPEHGDQWPRVLDWAEEAEDDATLLVPNNMLESWTDSFDEAGAFARSWRPGGSERGLVMERIPSIDDILLSHHAIPAFESERETILMNKAPYTRIPIENITVV